MKAPLYEISSRYLTVLDIATDPESGLDLGDTLSAVQGEWEEKALAVAGYFQGLEAQVSAMKEAEKRIAERRKHAENAVQRLKDYLQRQMEATGVEKVECPYFSISLAKCPPSVEIEDESLVPPEFKNIEIVEKIDKKAIKAAGGCQGARIVTDKHTLRIK